MSFKKATSISRAPMAALAAIGLFWGGFSALVPDIKSAVGASDAEFGAAMVLSALGGMVSMYMAPRAVELLQRYQLPVFGLALAAAFFYPLMPLTVTGLGLAFLAMGATVAMLDISANMRIAELEAAHGLHLMNLNHAMFSFAFGGTAFVTGLARRSGYDPEQILPALAVLGLVLAAATWNGRAARAPGAETQPDSHASMPWAAVWLAALILFGSFIGENATEAWSALHIERTLDGAPGEGGFGPAMLGLTMGVGRLSGQFFAEKLGEIRLIIGSAVLGVIGALVIGLAPSQLVALLGIGTLGFGMAVIVPSANSVLGKRVPRALIGLAISRAWMFGLTGFFVGPSLMGFVAEYFGLRAAFVVIGLIVGLIIPSAYALGKIPKRSYAKAVLAGPEGPR